MNKDIVNNAGEFLKVANEEITKLRKENQRLIVRNINLKRHMENILPHNEYEWKPEDKGFQDELNKLEPYFDLSDTMEGMILYLDNDDYAQIVLKMPEDINHAKIIIRCIMKAHRKDRVYQEGP